MNYRRAAQACPDRIEGGQDTAQIALAEDWQRSLRPDLVFRLSRGRSLILTRRDRSDLPFARKVIKALNQTHLAHRQTSSKDNRSFQTNSSTLIGRLPERYSTLMLVPEVMPFSQSTTMSTDMLYK
jgi:hypothetical protein